MARLTLVKSAPTMGKYKPTTADERKAAAAEYHEHMKQVRGF